MKTVEQILRRPLRLAAVTLMIMNMNAQSTIDCQWIDRTPDKDRHALFRARFKLEQPGTVRLKIFGRHWFQVWLDGDFLTDGPARHPAEHPQYEVFSRELGAGTHVLAWHAHELGVDTRLVRGDAPVGVTASVEYAGGHGVPLEWKALAPDAWKATGRRLGCVLGWVEWCDLRKLPTEWKSPGFDDSGWGKPAGWAEPCASFGELPLAALRRPVWTGKPAAQGELVNMSMIDHDPTSGFFIRELDHHTLPTQGHWWRFDLGRVRLGYPVLKVKAPPGTILQTAYAESLTFGRVHPYLKTGGGSDSCMLDHWVTRGGSEELIPLHPKGARFVEIHMIGNSPEGMELESFAFQERVYFPEKSPGSFECGDRGLDRAWAVGRDTFVACSEDSLTDNPHRERGQWLGEVEAPCIEMLSACYSDWRIARRSLEQAALCARPDGLLPAVYPGTREVIPSFSIQWVKAMLDYVRHTGDRSLLGPLHGAAERSLEALLPDLEEDGLRVNPEHWNFIDWGYRGANTVFLGGARDEARTDPALSLFYLEALDSMAVWSDWTGKGDRARVWRERAEGLRARLARRVGEVGANKEWEAFGYHATVLALRCGLVEEPGAAVASVKKFLLGCFPNDPAAPRLSDVTVESGRVMTPYFAHFSFPVLAAHGEDAFVLDQIRTCWGWMLDGGWTTWPEVFDPRWSHCHYWSSTPTWMLTRCALGLTPAFERGRGHYDWSFRPGGLDHAAGCIPLPAVDGGSPGVINIEWKRAGGGRYRYTLQSPEDLVIAMGTRQERVPAGKLVTLEVQPAPTRSHRP
jgi:alpha-L-rhamnosidase